LHPRYSRDSEKIALHEEEFPMSDRPWLEALKDTMRKHSADTNEPPEENLEALPLGGCERCESPANELVLVVEVQTTEEISDPWGEEEHRLIAAGWKPKERGGLVIWAHPKTGFYYSQEVALHRLEVLKNVGG